MSQITFVMNRPDENGLPDFDLPYGEWVDVLRPESLPTTVLEESEVAYLVIEVAGYRMKLIDEMFGLAIEIESEDMPVDLARRVVQEIKSNVERATGNSYQVIEMPNDRPYQF